MTFEGTAQTTERLSRSQIGPAEQLATDGFASAPVLHLHSPGRTTDVEQENSVGRDQAVALIERARRLLQDDDASAPYLQDALDALAGNLPLEASMKPLSKRNCVTASTISSPSRNRWSASRSDLAHRLMMCVVG